MTERESNLMLRFWSENPNATWQAVRAYIRANAITRPSHRETFYDGMTERIVGETFPVGPLPRDRRYCSYCYSSHRSWWEMDPNDYGGERVALCGHCEHATLIEDLEVISHAH